MDEILKKLSEIEDSACRILDRTSEQKARISEEIKARTEEYDRQMENEEKQQIEEIQAQLKTQREKELEGLRVSTEEQLKRLEQAFAQKHTELAKALTRKIVEA